MGDSRYQVRVPFLEEDMGAGSFLSNVLSRAGVRPCGGCGERAEVLDNWLLLQGREGEREKGEEEVERDWY